MNIKKQNKISKLIFLYNIIFLILCVFLFVINVGASANEAALEAATALNIGEKKLVYSHSINGLY